MLAASVTGAAHLRAGRPNQDAADCWESGDRTVVLAVADGHGGEAYARSDRGARFAVEEAIGACRDREGVVRVFVQAAYPWVGRFQTDCLAP